MSCSSEPGGTLRVLALVTDAFGGHGGISQYNRDIIFALVGCQSVLEVVVLPRLAGKSVVCPAGARQLSPVRGRLAYAMAALSTAKAIRANLVFCGHPFMAPLAAVVAKLLRAPLWVQVHGIDAWDELSSVYRWSLGRADLITSVSRYTRRRLLQWLTIDPGRVKVLPNTVGAEFRPGPKPARLLERYSVGGKKVLMTISRMASSERYKGHDRVIQALPDVIAAHPNAIYLMIGDGDDRPRLEALASDRGLTEKVRFVGEVPSDELPDHFRLADVVVMPSTGEGFGIVFLEAIASGVYPIAGDRDGSLDPLADGVLGLTVNPDSKEEIVTAIGSVLKNRPSTGARADRFNRGSFAEQLNNLIVSQFISTGKYRV